MGKRYKRTYFDDSAEQDYLTYGQYLFRLTELALSMFEWRNLPDSVDERFMELMLFNDGKVVFFKDEVMGYLCLQCTINGKLNVYRIPTKRRAYAVNGYNKQLDENNSVIIWNNYLHQNSIVQIKQFAKRLHELDRIIDVNANAQKTPVLVQGSETQRLTLINLYKEYEGNAPVIFGNKDLDIKALSVLNTEAPYICDKMYELKSQIWNEALTYLGISNTNITKKERMISDEVTRNMGGTIASRYSRLQARRQAVEQINKMFGLDIEVHYRPDYRESDDELMLPGATEDGVPSEMVVDVRSNTPYDKSITRQGRSVEL